MSALLVGGASTFVSCKDYDGDQAAQTIADLTEVRKIALDNQAALFGPDGNGGIVGDLKSLGLLSGSGFSEQFKDDLANLSTTTTNAREALAKAIAAQSTADEAKAWIEANTELELLKNHCAALADIAGCKDIILKLNDMKSIWGDDLSNVVVRTELAEYLKTADLEDKVAELGYEKVADMKQDVRDIINDWTAEIAGEEGVIKDYASLVAAFNQLPEKLVEINNTFEDIYEKLGIVNQMVAGLVTDINIDMVENPYFGTINTPLGIKSTMLIGFVGDQITKKQAAQFEGTEAGLAVSATGGAIYLTINPSDIDVKGMKFALVGRDESAAPAFTLKPLVADNTPVTTISTRANRTVNGYKAVFAIDKETATKAYPNIDKQALKDVATNVIGKLKGQEGLDIANAVKTIYDTFTGAIPQYYALQASWNETQLDGTSKTRYVNSDFKISAFTVKPLAYTTNIGAVGAKYDIPQIPSLQQWLNANITDISYSSIDPNSIEDVTVHIENAKNVKVEYEGQNPNGTVTFTPNSGSGDITMDFSKISVTGETLDVTVELDDLRKVVENLNAQVENMVVDVNKLFDKAESLAGRFDNIASKVNTVISAANKFLDNANQYLQPIMLAAGNGSLIRLSEVPGIYTQFKSNGAEGKIVLVPTSYTLELLAPAYLKKITVDNKEVTTTHDGTQKIVEAILEKGQHTITYSSMDYFGNVVTKDYYVEVK